MNRQYRRNNISRTFKDYLVPIIGLVLIIILLYSFFSGGTDTVDSLEDAENRIGYSLNFGDIETEAFIEYTGGNKEKVENATEIFKGEKLIVKEGSVSLKVGENTSINVDKIGEVKLGDDGSLALFSSNMWVSSQDPLVIDLRYGKVKTTGPSILSLAQNEVGSTVYILSGTAEVSNLVNQSTLIGKGQKINISRLNASKEDIDLSLSKEDLDNYFLQSDWFLENNGPALLSSIEETPDESGSGSTTTQSNTSISKLITFDTIEDESTVTTDSIELTGTYSNENIGRIVIGDKVAQLDTDAKTFSVESVSTSEKENDIIIKIYTANDKLLGKDVITVYTTNATTPTANEPLFKVENYSLDATEFQFISPKQNPYTTDTGVVMIEGRVPVGIVKKIQVNGYQLRKFPQYGTYWAYFANQEFGNLKPGLNVYKVEYIAQDDSVLHSNAFTIIKNEETQAEASVVSDEADTTEE